MADNALTCLRSDEYNVRETNSSRVLIAMKTSNSRKRKLAAGGTFTGRWAKKEHIQFLKGTYNTH